MVSATPQSGTTAELPAEIPDVIGEIDAFIESEIRPLEQADDNIRFFDHRREHSRTDWEAGGRRAASGRTCSTK